MRSLLLAGTVLLAVASSAQAWTQSILHPEGQGAAVTLNGVTPRYTIYGGDGGRSVQPARPAKPVRAAPAPGPFADDSEMLHHHSHN
ncbi:hypothetical protein U8607_21680 [Methylobacterium durans]|uniref:hypothetical protein n=1 Tax=Methylobacterium durans TaxID=2202825 RepID=UPI002B000538|nr:hypothetical protein [Methylobacterium durans]MEA1834709.1 hypothetical protein [Methylobacterium durans]